jgi:hypothetical protein
VLRTWIEDNLKRPQKQSLAQARRYVEIDNNVAERAARPNMTLQGMGLSCYPGHCTGARARRARGDDLLQFPDLLDLRCDGRGRIRNCMLKLVERYETKESVIVDRLLRSTEALYVRKQALFVEMEQSLFEGMLELWPSTENPEALRVAAMTGMRALRLAMDKWRQENAKLPLAYYAREVFDLLERQV